MDRDRQRLADEHSLIEQLNATPYAEMGDKFPQHADQIRAMIAEIEPLLALIVQLTLDAEHTFTHEATKEEFLYTETLKDMSARLMQQSPRDVIGIIRSGMLAQLERISLTPRRPAVFENLQVWQPLVFDTDGTLNFNRSFPQDLVALMDELTSLFMQYNQLKGDFAPSPPAANRRMPTQLARILNIAGPVASISPGFGGVTSSELYVEPMSPRAVPSLSLIHF